MMEAGITPDNLSFHFLRKTYNRRGDRKALQRIQEIQNSCPRIADTKLKPDSRLRLPHQQSSRSYMGSPHSNRAGGRSPYSPSKGSGKGGEYRKYSDQSHKSD